jgi:uncharacterized damage-inducible protein DinB
LTDLLGNVRSVLSTTPTRWEALVGALPDELLTRPPGPGEWSAADCLKHLEQVEREVFAIRMRTFLEGGGVLEDFDPDAQPPEPVVVSSLRELAADLARRRRSTLDSLSRLEAGDLARVAEHEALGRVTLGEMLAEWAAHDLTHTIQAERAVMRSFVSACGPWRRFFADNDISAP